MEFQDFKADFAATACISVPPDVFAKYEELLPPSLSSEWRQSGWCGYGDGFFWFDDPRKFMDFSEKWQGCSGAHVVFARTAFGDLFSLHEGKVFATMTQFKDCDLLTADFDFFGYYSLRSQDFLEEFMRQSLFKAALAKLGPIARDECYAFVPTLALGGEARIENVRKAKLLEYLDILSQLD